MIGAQLLGLKTQLITGYKGSADYVVAAIRGDSDAVIAAIPTTLRGRFFAFAGVGASVAGLGAGLLTAWLLSAVPAPRSYGLCFLLCALFMAVSYAALTSVREMPRPVAPSSSRWPRRAVERRFRPTGRI